MKTQLALIALLALAGVSLFSYNTEEVLEMTPQASLFQEYQQWKSLHNKNTNGEEDLYRFQVYSENKKVVQDFNAEQNGAELSMNEFADLPNEEFVAKLTGVQESEIPETDEQIQIDSTYSTPTSVDWSQKGAVSPIVPNQGQCGSCWAFSTTASLEGLQAVENGRFEYFSQQQIVSCTYSRFGAYQGCNGSRYPYFPWKYTTQHGIMLAESYPYVQGEKGHQDPLPCNYKASEVVFRHTSSSTLSHPSNEQIYQVVEQQPNSVLVDVGLYFQLYNGGVLPYSKCKGKALNHAVLLVGYNTKPSGGDVPYFKIRNSWGGSWGENGYIRLAIDDSQFGTCGVKSIVSRPLA